jgi:hypothetical protein
VVVWVEGNRKLTNDLHCHYAVTQKKLSKNALETLNELLGLVLRTPVVLRGISLLTRNLDLVIRRQSSRRASRLVSRSQTSILLSLYLQDILRCRNSVNVQCPWVISLALQGLHCYASAVYSSPSRFASFESY